ncbi:radical SAM protein [Thermococcus aggregans]|uniref:Radical SAM protein n=1 Tax=Thermococcus aggregans TaxID=110163 RepID=A0A9E7SNK9_THEAG|nr:radical SAM protein [Thermococcus aggregans]USS39897.1 radical SAM protein [Thermococcus aggregans]
MISRFVVKINLSNGEYLLINTKNGSMIKVDNEALGELEKENPELDSNILSILKRSGFIIDKPDDEELEKYFKWLWDNIYSNNYHIIVVTYTCNLNCSYCYQKNIKRKKDLTTEQVDKIFEAILKFDNGEVDNRKSKIRNIQLYGGEPLQKRLYEIIEYILEIGSSYGYNFIIMTNAIDLDSYLELLDSYKDSIALIQTTIDGPKEVHDSYRYNGAFEKTISNIEKVIEMGFKVDLRTNVSKENIKYLEELARFYIEKGWTNKENVRFYLAPVRNKFGPCYFNPNLSFDEILNLFRSELITKVFGMFNGLFVKFYEGIWIPQFYNCPAHYRQIFYDPYGDLYTCMSALRMKELSIGKYYPTFKLNDRFQLYRRRNIFNIEKCKNCELALICGGGCSYNAFLKTGDLANSDCYSMKILEEKFFRLFEYPEVLK